MRQTDLDEISILERDACIESIIGMMECFEISVDDIEAAFLRRQVNNYANDRTPDIAIAMEVI